jgi:glycosyltransferase involved in cell wall biosynthesis
MTQRIVQVVQHLAPGGIEMLVLELQRLAGPGAEFHVVSLEGTPETIGRGWSRAGLLGTRLHALDKQPGIQPALVLSLARLFRRLRPAVVQTHHIGPLIYGGMAARLAGIPRLVHTEHDAWHLANPQRRRLQQTALSLIGPQVIAAGRAVADGLTTAIPSCRPTVIANGVDTGRFRPGDRDGARRRLRLPAGPRIVGAAGRLEMVKGHDVLIDAAYRLPPHIHVAIAGDGSSRHRLEKQAGGLGIGDRIHFLGLVDDIATFYQAIDLYCLPSRNEGLPLSLLEAQASAVPAVASNVGSVAEALCPGASLLVPPEDSQALAVAISTAMSAMVDGAGGPPPGDPRGFVMRHHDLAAMARSYRAVISA